MTCDSCTGGCPCAPNVTLDSGMVRSNDTDKPDYTTVDLDFLERFARHMTANIADKGHNNWRLASTEDDRARFKQSAWRHFVAWQRGDTDEDHASALVFNVIGAEHVSARSSSG